MRALVFVGQASLQSTCLAQKPPHSCSSRCTRTNKAQITLYVLLRRARIPLEVLPAMHAAKHVVRSGPTVHQTMGTGVLRLRFDNITSNADAGSTFTEKLCKVGYHAREN